MSHSLISRIITYRLLLCRSIRTCFAEQEKRFAPTFLALINYAAMAPGVRPYSQLKSARIPKVLEAKAKKTKKGRARQRRGSMSTSLTGEGEEPSAAFVAEKAWLIDWLCECEYPLCDRHRLMGLQSRKATTTVSKLRNVCKGPMGRLQLNVIAVSASMAR